VHTRYPIGYAYDQAVKLCPGIIALSSADQESRLLTLEKSEEQQIT